MGIVPLIVPEKQFDVILSVLSRYEDGASISTLLADRELDYAKRTLQRRLDQLVREERVSAVGNGRARRYVLPSPSDPAPTLRVESPTTAFTSGTPSWLSPEGREIRAAVNSPLSERHPVGYQREFLAGYRPNVTGYLPAELRAELAGIGKVGITGLPAGTYLREVLNRLLIDLSWNSCRLEGNTYSLLETQRLLQLGEAAEGKAVQETQMILNHKAAIEMLADQADEVGFNRYTLCNLHALLAENLLPDRAAAGLVRSRPVGISGTVFHPLSAPDEIGVHFDLILSKAEKIRDPFEQAFFAMVHLPYLQPFEDVNKRVSRLAANIPLVRHNLCPLSFADIDAREYVGALLGVYELNRVDYLRDVFAFAYRRSGSRYAAVRQSLGDPDPFRLRHRIPIHEAVRTVVERGLDKGEVAEFLKSFSGDHLPAEDSEQFVTEVGEELTALHIGNIARYRLRPAVFESWQTGWR